MADRAQAPVVACAVVARPRLPAARVLVAAYLRQHPDHDVLLLLTDGVRPGDECAGATLVGPDRLDVDGDEYLRLATCGSAARLAAAVTPLLVRRLVGRYPVVLVLPVDGLVLHPFPDLPALVERTGIGLVPRVLAAPAPAGRPPTEIGGFDPDVLAIGRGGPNVKAFLDFWSERARESLLSAPWPALAGERTWLDDVPALFDHEVLRSPGFAIAWWNLAERELLRAADGTVTVAGEPVSLVRFPGFDPDRPWLLDAGADRPSVLLSERPVLRALCADYRDRLAAETGYGPAEPYRFDSFPDGEPITEPMRAVYRAAWLDRERAAVAPEDRFAADAPPPRQPFGADQGVEFRRWLTEPTSSAERAAGLNRLLMGVWARRADLRSVFHDPVAASADAFRSWCRTHGVAEDLVPAWAVPADRPEPLPPVDEFGVNLAGYLTAELGVGEMARIVHDTLLAAGVPMVSVVEDRSLAGLCRTGLAAPDTVGAPRFGVSVIAVNADFTAPLLASCPDVGHDRYRIGLWAWELDEFPESMHHGFGLVDEVWTVSEFSRAAIAEHATVPVRVWPAPVADPGAPPRGRRQPGEPTTFLFLFDFNSTAARKNPWGAVAAFQRAFPGRDDIRLVIKATNGHLHVPEVERLRHVIGGDRRIELILRYLEVAELHALYARSDAYVSLHRSEGFGLTVAEAMIRGMPVVATDYSGTAEFLDETVGWPVPHTMTAVGADGELYPAHSRWADPDLAAAAAALREIADDPDEAHRRGTAAREHLLRTRSVASAADWVRERLTEAHHTWLDRRAARPAPVDPLTVAEAAIRSDADPTTASRLPLATTLRRVVRRAINHYDAHQRTVHAALLDAIGAVERRTTARQSGVEHRQAERIAELAARLDRLERSAREQRRR